MFKGSEPVLFTVTFGHPVAAHSTAVGVIWMQSDFSERAKPAAAEPRAPGPGSRDATSPRPATRPAAEPDGSTADVIGRTAGRLAGKGVNIYRARKAAGQRKPG